MNKKITKKILALTIPILPSIPFVLMNANKLPETHKNIYKHTDRSYYYDESNFYIDQYDFSDWLSGVNDNKSLFDLSIPGTHDSAMWTGSGVAWTFGSSFAKTQGLNIENQLKLGIRAFDLRLDDEMWLRHGATYSVIRFWDWMNSAVEFLKKHPTEFIIARVKDESMDVNDPNLAAKASRYYMYELNKHINYIYNPEGKLANEVSWKLRDIRGKIIFINHWHHKVNESRVGGMLYHDVIRRSRLQDQYEQYDTDNKQQAIRDNMQNSNNSPINELLFYVNFNSVSSSASWRPWNYAQEHNRRTNEFLIENQQLTKLGIVYFDFPGPSIVQAIFKTNYYLNDAELQANYDKDYVTNLEISQLRSDSTQFTITGNASDFNLVIYRDDFPFFETTIPSDAKQSYTIDTNELFELNTEYKFRFYKTTPSNMFYTSRNYNEIEIIKDVYDVNYLIDLNYIRNDVNQAIIQFNSNSPTIVRYINSYFKHRLDQLSFVSVQNRIVLNEMIRLWRMVKPQFDYLQSMINDHNHLMQDINQTKNNFSHIFNQTVNGLFANLEVNFNNQINQSLNSNLEPQQLNFNPVSRLLRTHKKINQKIKQYLDIFTDTQILNIVNNIKTNQNDYHFGINKWITKINEISSDLNNKITEVFNNNEIVVNTNEYHQFLNDHKNDLVKLNDLVNQINHKANEFNFNINEMRLFESSISDAIINLSDANDLIAILDNYNDLINQSKTLINDLEFKNQYDFSFLNNIKRDYLNEINLLKAKLNQQKSHPNSSDDYNQSITRINDLKQKIIDQFQTINQTIDFINNQNELFETQKQNFIFLLNQNELTNEKIEEIKKQVILWNSKNLRSQLNNWTSLNDLQKQSFQNEIIDRTSIDSIDDLVNQYQQINNKQTQLKNLINAFSDYENLIGYEYYDASKRNDFITAYNQANNVLTINANLSTIIQNYNNLNRFALILNHQFYEQIQTIINQINNSTQIYNFKKLNLINKIKSSNNQQELDSYLNEFHQLEQLNEIQNDVNLFNEINPSRKNRIIQQLKDSADQQNYQNHKENAITLLNAYKNALNTKEQNKNYKSSVYYIKNSAQNQQALDASFELLNQILSDSNIDDYDILSNRELNFLNEINKAKVSSQNFITNEKTREALDDYNQSISTLNQKMSQYTRADLQEYTKNYFAEINNSISNSNAIALKNNASINEIKQQTNTINQKINDFDKHIQTIISLYEQDKLEIQKFNQYYDEVQYEIENKENLPDYYLANNDLIILHKPNNEIEVIDLQMIPNNENGELKLSYKIVYKNKSKTKNQLITDLDSNQKINARHSLNQAKQEFYHLKENIKTWLDHQINKTDVRFLEQKQILDNKLQEEVNNFNNNENDIEKIKEINQNLILTFDQIKEEFIRIAIIIAKEEFVIVKNKIEELVQQNNDSEILNIRTILENLTNDLANSQDLVNQANTNENTINEQTIRLNAKLLETKENITLEIQKDKKRKILESYNNLLDTINQNQTKIIDQLQNNNELKKIFSDFVNEITTIKNNDALDYKSLKNKYDEFITKSNQLQQKLNLELTQYFNQAINNISVNILNKFSYYASQITKSNLIINNNELGLSINEIQLIADDTNQSLMISFNVSLNELTQQKNITISGFKDVNFELNQTKQQYTNKKQEIENLFVNNIKKYESIIKDKQIILEQINNEVKSKNNLSTYQKAITLIDNLMNQTTTQIANQQNWELFLKDVDKEEITLNIKDNKSILASEVNASNLIATNKKITAKNYHLEANNNTGKLRVVVSFSWNDLTTHKDFYFNDFKTNTELSQELKIILNSYINEINTIVNQKININHNLQTKVDELINQLNQLKDNKQLYLSKELIQNELTLQKNELIKQISSFENIDEKQNNKQINQKLEDLILEINQLKDGILVKLNNKESYINNYNGLINEINDVLNSNQTSQQKQTFYEQQVNKKQDILTKVNEDTKNYFNNNINKIKVNILNLTSKNIDEIQIKDLIFNNQDLMIDVSNIKLNKDNNKLIISFNASLNEFNQNLQLELNGFKQQNTQPTNNQTNQEKQNQEYLWALVAIPLIIIIVITWLIIKKIKKTRKG